MPIGVPSSSFPPSSAAAAALSPAVRAPAAGALPRPDPAPVSPVGDRAEISALGYRMLDQAEAEDTAEAARSASDADATERQPAETAGATADDRGEVSEAEQAADPRGLSEEELRQVEEMAQRDREVRQHEMAHLAAAGRHARGGMSLRFERGPDGQPYAVAGSVSIDTGPEADPQRTMAKMQQVRRAALAPAQPSSQDRMVAAQAAMRERAARAEYMQQQAEAVTAYREPDEAPAAPPAIAASSAGGPTTGQLR